MKTIHEVRRRSCLFSAFFVLLRDAERAIDEALITRSNPDRWYRNDPETAAIALENAVNRAMDRADEALECLATHYQRQKADFRALGIKV